LQNQMTLNLDSEIVATAYNPASAMQGPPDARA
jgi:hypothetical protein